MNDEHWLVRKAVAEQGYGLDLLINDRYWLVKIVVQEWLKTHNLTLEKWAQLHPERCAMNK